MRNLKVVDVTPLSIGQKMHNGEMQFIIPRNTQIPCEKVVYTANAEDNQEYIETIIRQGELPMADDNYRLGSFSMPLASRAKAGHVKIEDTFKVDENGILSVTSKECVKDGAWKTIQVQTDKCRLTEEDLNRHKLEARKWAKMDNDYEKQKIICNECQSLKFMCDEKLRDC